MTERRNEKGTALIIALLVMVIMTLLGIPFLMMGETENRIAENERLALQAQYAAEAGARMVRNWFDHPTSPLNAVAPDLAAVNRSQRLIDDDNDPTTAPVAADGSPGLPYYKQADNTIFQKPFRGSLVDTLLGSEDGPDMRIARADSVEAETFLDTLSQKLFQGYVNAGGTSARITAIDVYSPPMTQRAGDWVRLGVGTVKVEAGIYLPLPGGGTRTLAERSVRFVFNEIPYQNEKLGALHTCGDLHYPQRVSPRWGVVTAEGDAEFNAHVRIPAGIPRNLSTSLVVDSLWPPAGTLPTPAIRFQEYYDLAAVDGEILEDPWFRLIVGGDISPAPSGTQPWPFEWTGGPLADGEFTSHVDDGSDDVSNDGDADVECGIGLECDGTHSGLVQNVTDIGCPDFPYEVWKSVALRGGPNIHYFAWDAAEEAFKENGTGDAKSFLEWTHNGEGLFFFDTIDGAPPASDGSNLTPDLFLEDVSWSVSGVVYLNAAKFGTHRVTGNYIDYFPPGEPFLDLPVGAGNGVYDPGEPFVNVEYPLDLVSDMKIDSTDAWTESGSPAVVRNPRGPAINAKVNVYGILYNSGLISSTGRGWYYGSLISGSGIDDLSDNPDGPRSYWDASMRDGDWPPPAWGLPRVVVTRWETGT